MQYNFTPCFALSTNFLARPNTACAKHFISQEIATAEEKLRGKTRRNNENSPILLELCIPAIPSFIELATIESIVFTMERLETPLFCTNQYAHGYLTRLSRSLVGLSCS